MKNEHKGFLTLAINLAEESATSGSGPFGCVITKNSEIVAKGFNQVTVTNDPTAHAEIQTIRAASAALSNFDLSECVLYSSSYPCPMCIGAIFWARIDKVYYANEMEKASEAGFDDKNFYQKLGTDNISEVIQIEIPNSDKAFEIWNKNSKKIKY